MKLTCKSADRLPSITQVSLIQSAEGINISSSLDLQSLCAHTTGAVSLENTDYKQKSLSQIQRHEIFYYHYSQKKPNIHLATDSRKGKLEDSEFSHRSFPHSLVAFFCNGQLLLKREMHDALFNHISEQAVFIPVTSSGSTQRLSSLFGTTRGTQIQLASSTIQSGCYILWF